MAEPNGVADRPRRERDPRQARHSLLAVAVLLLGFGLRLHRVEAQSLWYDEGTSAALVGRSPAEILDAAANDIHPPLYYLALSAWSRLGGDGVLSLRFFSAASGTALVALVIALGRRLWNESVGLVAGVLAAGSPFLVWYSQEVRMYMLAAALGAALVLVALELTSGSLRRTHWVAYVALATAALLTQYFVGASALLAANLVGLAWIGLSGSGARRTLLGLAPRWLAANVAVVALVAPWLRRGWPALRDWPAVGPRLGSVETIRQSLEVYALGARVPPEARAWLGAIVLLFAVGALLALLPHRRRPALAALAYALAPVILLVAAATRRPLWDPKFVVAGAPGFELVAASGAVALASAGSRLGAARLAGAALVSAALILVAATSVARTRTLEAQYYDPAYQRDDYRGVVATIDARAGGDDAVILTAPTQIEVFELYDRSRHFAFPLPLGRRPPAADTVSRLEHVGDMHRDLFGVLWAEGEADPERVVERWLDQHRHKAWERWFGNVRLALWVAPREPMTERLSSVASGAPYRVGFGDDEIALERLSATDALRPGGPITIEAVWRALSPPRGDYVVFVHLVGDGGIVAQRDLAPVGGSARTSQWEPQTRSGGPVAPAEDAGSADGDASVLDRIGLEVPPDLPPGRYRLLLGLYDPATGRRLAVAPAPGSGAAPEIENDAVVVGTYDVP